MLIDLPEIKSWSTEIDETTFIRTDQIELQNGTKIKIVMPSDIQMTGKNNTLFTINKK